jgi:hypothetical protein
MRLLDMAPISRNTPNTNTQYSNGTRNSNNLSITLYYLSVNTYYCVYIMSHGPGRIQREMLQLLRDRSIAVDTAELARRVYLARELMPAQRVASWRALNGLEQRGLVIRRSRRGRCYWSSSRSATARASC